MPGGQSQPSAVQPPSRGGHRDPLGSGVEPAGAAEVEDLGLAAEDGGDDPGLAGEPSGWPGADAVAGVEDRGLQSARSACRGHGDHDGGVDAAGLREPVGGVALDELGRTPARAVGAGRRSPRRLGGGPVLGGGDGEQRSSSASPPCSGGRVNRPWPCRGRRRHRQPGRLRGLSASSFSSRLGFVGVGLVGGDDLEDPPAEDPAGPWRRGRRRRDQVLLGLDDQVGVEVVGQVVQPRRMAWACSRFPAACARPGGSWVSSRSRPGHRCAAPGLPGGVRQPVRRTGRAGLAGQVESRRATSGRALSSAIWASAFGPRPCGAVSVASIDHRLASATWVSSARTAATAVVTRCGCWAIAVMTPCHRPPPTAPADIHGNPVENWFRRPAVDAGWSRAVAQQGAPRCGDLARLHQRLTSARPVRDAGFSRVNGDDPRDHDGTSRGR